MNRGGLALMEVRRITVRNNRAWANSDHGIMLRTIQDSLVENNVVAGNQRGFFIYDAEYNILRGNSVIDNVVGVHLWAGSKNNDVEEATTSSPTASRCAMSAPATCHGAAGKATTGATTLAGTAMVTALATSPTRPTT
jgi:parallel beta-helix repeat protein